MVDGTRLWMRGGILHKIIELPQSKYNNPPADSISSPAKGQLTFKLIPVTADLPSARRRVEIFFLIL